MTVTAECITVPMGDGAVLINAHTPKDLLLAYRCFQRQHPNQPIQMIPTKFRLTDDLEFAAATQFLAICEALSEQSLSKTTFENHDATTPLSPQQPHLITLTVQASTRLVDLVTLQLLPLRSATCCMRKNIRLVGDLLSLMQTEKFFKQWCKQTFGVGEKVIADLKTVESLLGQTFYMPSERS